MKKVKVDTNNILAFAIDLVRMGDDLSLAEAVKEVKIAIKGPEVVDTNILAFAIDLVRMKGNLSLANAVKEVKKAIKEAETK